MCVGSPHPCFVHAVVSRGRATTASGISLLPGWMGHPSCPSMASPPAGGTFVQLVLPLSVLSSLAFSAGGGSLGRRKLGWQARWPWTSPLSYSSFLSPQGARPWLSPAPCSRQPVAPSQGQSRSQRPPPRPSLRIAFHVAPIPFWVPVPCFLCPERCSPASSRGRFLLILMHPFHCRSPPSPYYPHHAPHAHP